MDNPNIRPPLSEALFSDRKLFQSLSELYASKNFNRGVLFKNADFQRQNKKTYAKKSKLQNSSSAPTSPASSNGSTSLKRPIDHVAIKQEEVEDAQCTSSEEKMLLSPTSSGDVAANCFNNININITNTSTNIVAAREPRVNSLMTNLHRSASESALNTLSWISTSSIPNSPMLNISTDAKSSPSVSKKRKVAGFSLDVNARLDVSFEESIQGCKKMLEYDCYVMCDKCGGEARKDNHNNNNNNNDTVGCTQCNGMIWKTKKAFEVDIPPYGAKNGFKKTYKGLGSKGEDGAVGDLVVEFQVADHPFFKRNSDDDTVCDVHISVYQAVLGTKVQIPKLYSKDGEKIEVSIKAGIQPNTVIRMPNQGFTKSNCKKKRGDLFINILVDIPTQLTQQQKELFERLAVIDSMFDLHLQPSPPSSPVHSKDTSVTAEQTIPHALISLRGDKQNE